MKEQHLDQFNLKELSNSLIIELVRLFSVFAKLDGNVSEDEKAYVKKYLFHLYPENFADRLNGYFLKLIEEDLSLSSLSTADSRFKYRYEERFYILFKLFELAVSDGLADEEREGLKNIAQSLNIQQDDYHLAESILSYHYDDAVEREALNDQSQGPNLLRFSNADGNSQFLVVRIKGQLFCYSFVKGLQLGSRGLLRQHLTRLNDDDHLLVNKKLIGVKEFKFLFKCYHKDLHIKAPGQALKDALPIQGECHFTIGRDGFYLNSSEEKNIPVHYLSEIDGINAMTYFIAHSNFDLTSIPQKEEVTIGNSFIYDIEIVDDIDDDWYAIVKKDGNELVIDRHSCPHDIFVKEKRCGRHHRTSIDQPIEINAAIVWWDKERAGFRSVSTVPDNVAADELSYIFNDKSVGLDKISFKVNSGELVAVMGPSGSGKSTLLSVLNGALKPTDGGVWFDSVNMYDQKSRINSVISFTPQDDLLFENLTVYENLMFNCKIRHLGDNVNHKKIVSGVLKQIGLEKKKNLIVGNPENKTISGGERKRLNLGLELLQEKDIFLFDEPTTGLSSKDSEKIVSIMKRLCAKDKIIFTVIHQPDKKLFLQFDKLLLLDRGGRLVYYGPVGEAFDYFYSYADNFLKEEIVGREDDPSVILEIMEQPMRDIDGRPLSFRKYDGDFWSAEFARRIAKPKTADASEKQKKEGAPERFYRRGKKKLKEQFKLFNTLFKRNIISKGRDITNIYVSFIIPPLLAAIIGFILRYKAGDTYTVYGNIHLATFFFLASLIAIFLGLTNSIEEVIRDRRILLREKRIHKGAFVYYLSKMLVLIIFAIVQNAIFLSVSFLILGLNELFFSHFLLLTVISMVGISMGLLISSIPKMSAKAANNIIPMVLIPQIIFGGALISYKEMNENLTLMDNNPIPEICQVIPSRWGFEAMLVNQAYHNSFHPRENEINEELKEYRYKIRRNKLVDDYVSQGMSKSDAEARVTGQQEALELELKELTDNYREDYGNQGIEGAVYAARLDLESEKAVDNWLKAPLFTKKKSIGLLGTSLSTPVLNSIVLLLMFLLFFFAGVLLLRRTVFR